MTCVVVLPNLWPNPIVANKRHKIGDNFNNLFEFIFSFRFLLWISTMWMKALRELNLQRSIKLYISYRSNLNYYIEYQYYFFHIQVLLNRDILDSVKSYVDLKRSCRSSYSQLEKLICSPVLKECYLTGVPASWFADTSECLEKSSREQSESDGMLGVHFVSERYMRECRRCLHVPCAY